MRAKVPFRPWDTRPRLSPRLGWVMEAFAELQTCRTMVGKALGPIPWTAVHEYAGARRVTDVERFERLIRALDTAFLEHQHKEPGRHRGKSPPTRN